MKNIQFDGDIDAMHKLIAKAAMKMRVELTGQVEDVRKAFPALTVDARSFESEEQLRYVAVMTALICYLEKGPYVREHQD